MSKRIPFCLLPVLAAFLLAACSPGSPIIRPRDGYAEGGIGDTMRTYFFDYTVDSAMTYSRYEGYVPTPGYDLLLVEITVTNTFPEDITMFDWDFMVLFDDILDGEEVYDYPITSYEEVEIPDAARDTLLPMEYDLNQNEKRTGFLLFEVPAGETQFTISYIEYFDDDTTGDAFYVDFTARHI